MLAVVDTQLTFLYSKFMKMGFLFNLLGFCVGSRNRVSRNASRSIAWQIDERLAPFILVTEVADGRFFIGDLFQRKFGHLPPDFGHHIVAFYRDNERIYLPASYLYLWTQGTIGLFGGGCTDGRVLRAMAPEQASLLNQAGGLLRQTHEYCFAKFGSELEAFFGHCGNPRTKEVIFQAGLRETRTPYLFVRYNKSLKPKRQEELLRQAEAIGAF
jgi:hypothetical protein